MKLQDALQLIDNHSQSAIDQITPPLSRRDVEVSSPAEALRLAFLWRTSREGYNFWRDVHNKLESCIPIPEPVPVLAPEPEPEPVPVLTPEPVPPTSLSAPVPRDLLPLPRVPDGFSHWVYRGTGWSTHGRAVCFHCRRVDENTWEGIAPLRCDAGGFENLHYIEAVREPLQCEVGRCYVQRDGIIRDPLVPTPPDLRGVEYHPFWDGCFYRTPEGYIFTDDPRGSSGYIAEVEPQ